MVAAPSPVPATRGGFAATFAAAQGLAAGRPNPANAGAGTGASGTAGTNPVSSRALPMPPAPSAQSKKLLANSSAANASLSAGINLPVPAPDASLIALSIPLSGTLQTVSSGVPMQSGLPLPAASGAVGAAAISSAPQSLLSGLATVTNQLPGPASAKPSSGAQNFGASLAPGEVVGGAVKPDMLAANKISAGGDASVWGLSPGKGSPAGVGETAPPAGPVPVEVPVPAKENNSNQNDTAAVTAQSQVTTVAYTAYAAAGPNPANDFAAAAAGQMGVAISNPASDGAGAGVPISGQALPDAAAGAGRNAGTLMAAAINSQDALLNFIHQTAPDGATVSPNLPGDALSGSAAAGGNAPSLAPLGNLPSALVPVIPALAPVPEGVPRVTAAASPVARTQGQSAVGSGGSGASPAGTNSSAGSAGGSQTPFSVFFSGSGPGAEAAAAALPKMILPGTAPVPGNSHAVAGGPAGASAQSGGTPASSAPSNSTPSTSAQTSKDAPAAVAGGSPAIAPPAHHTGDASAASVQLVAAQAAAPASSAAAPNSTATVLALGAPPAPAADSALAANALPAAVPLRTPSAVPEQSPVVAGPVQMAQLMARAGQAEMRIGMNTSAFGSVEVRTVVHANDVGLVIGSEKGDLRTLLANDIPVITNSLQQQNLRLNSVNFMQGFAFSNNASGGGDGQPRPYVAMRAPAISGLSPAAEEPKQALPAGQYGSASSSLSILA
jgi:flagellar hook-length control protein FliK